MRRTKEASSLELIRGVLDSLPDHIAVVDRSGTIIAVNQAWLDFAMENGAAPSEVSVGANYLKVCRQAAKTGDCTAEQVLVGLGSVLGGDSDHFVMDYECPAPSGERWFKITVLRQNAPRRGAVILHSDITDRKKTEEALRRSKEWFQLLTDSLPVLISYVDQDQRYRFNNKGYELWFGYSPQEVEGKHLRQLLGDKAYEAIRPRVEAALAGNHVRFEELISFHGAGRRYVQVTYVPDKQDDRIRGYFALIQDLTARKQAEEEIRESRDQLSTIITGADIGTWDWDLPAETVDVNDRYCTMLGYEPGRFGRQAQRFFESVHPDDIANLQNQLADHFSGANAFFRCDFRLRMGDGSYRWIHGAGRLVGRTPAGAPKRMVGIHIDITERKSYEEAMQAQREALRNLAAEIAQTQEKERRQIADDLHDQIGQNLVLAKMKLGELNTLSAGQFAGAIEQVRALVDQSIKETRSLIRDLSPQVLYELGLEAALEWLVEQTQAKYGLRCSAEVAPVAKRLREDIRVILFQAVRELLVNVAKHAKASRATVILRADESRVTVQVVDDGCGFDPSALTLPSSTVRGFGLFSIRERVALLGGELHIESTPERGARVTVSVPASK